MSEAVNHIRTFRIVYYLSLLQLLAFVVVPVFLFPAEYLLTLEILSALTFALVVGIFVFLVSIAGLLLDTVRRKLYIVSITVIGLWFIWAGVSWTYIEHMDYLFH